MSHDKKRFDPLRPDISLPKRVKDAIIPDLLKALNESQKAYGKDFATGYLIEELLTKFIGKDTDPALVRRQRAIDKFRAVERHNARVNVHLFTMAYADEHDLGWTTTGRLFRRVQRHVRYICGPLDVNEVFKTFSHTNGASTRVRRSSSSAVHKLLGEAHISLSALPHWLRIVCDPVREHINGRQTVTLRESSGLFTVPKKSDIDRVACKEPELNMLMQRACGRHLRQRLLVKTGINLRDQTINQEKARNAYRDGFATIDLSSASDTVTHSLVQLMLPWEWYSLLDDLRVKTTLIDKKEHTLELFSTMGNGFTFELESILFYAITRAVCELSGFDWRSISVYGDDIIAPSGVTPRLMRTLEFFGFKPNLKKTHYTGTFRESCGKHYERGFDVTPFYIWRPIEILPDLIRLLNRVMEWDGRGWGFMATPELASFHWKYSKHVPRRYWGGIDPEDCSALVTGDRPRMRLVPRVKEVEVDPEAAMIHWLMSKEVNDESESMLSDPWTWKYDGIDISFNGQKVVVDPNEVLGFKAIRARKGWYTSWRPWMIFPGPERK